MVELCGRARADVQDRVSGLVLSLFGALPTTFTSALQPATTVTTTVTQGTAEPSSSSTPLSGFPTTATTTTSSSLPTTPPGGGSLGAGSLSAGDITGIVIGILIGVFLLLALLACCTIRGLWAALMELLGLKRRRRGRQSEEIIERVDSRSTGRNI